jgi:DNA (cytosine-5)-methyltransferase 1
VALFVWKLAIRVAGLLGVRGAADGGGGMTWKHVSLFAGVGGADLGMEAAGIDTALACEIDNHARGVLAHRFPNAKLWDDVRSLDGDRIRNAGAVPERTILSGGFPCQPFSVAGRRGGMGGDDERGDLYWEISRILAEFPAQWIVLENVPGLLSIDDGRTFGTILGDLAELGYGVAYRVLDAQFFGVPQRRRRVFIVGCLGDDRRPVEVLLEPEGGGGDPGARTSSRPGVARGSVVSTLQAGGGSRGYRVDAESAAGGHLVPYVKAKRASTEQDDETWRADEISPTLNVFDNNGETRATVLAIQNTTIGRADTSGPMGPGWSGGPMFTLDTTDPHGIAGDLGVRRLTPRECERLMGWPDDHTRIRSNFLGDNVEQADSHRYKQCGNGMAAPVVTWIASRILATEGATAMPDPATHRVTLVLDDGWLAELEKWRTVAEADETFVIESVERAS